VDEFEHIAPISSSCNPFFLLAICSKWHVAVYRLLDDAFISVYTKNGVLLRVHAENDAFLKVSTLATVFEVSFYISLLYRFSVDHKAKANQIVCVFQGKHIILYGI